MSMYIINRLLLTSFIIGLCMTIHAQTNEIAAKSESKKNCFKEFKYTKFLEYHIKHGYKYEIPDSDYISENIERINEDVCLIMVEEAYKNHFKSEIDFYVSINDSFILLNGIKNNRKGQLNYLGSDEERIYFALDLFVDEIDKVEIVSDSPQYCRLFKYSELWMFSLKNRKAVKIDKDDGEYQNLKIGKKSIEVEVFPKGSKQLYYNNFPSN